MKKIYGLFLVLSLVGCQDKVVEDGQRVVTTPSICTPGNPELEETQYKFEGVSSISNVEQTNVTINWSHVEGLQNYNVLVVGKSREVVATVKAPKTSVKVKGLTPDTEYTFMVRAMDKHGFIDGNMESLKVRTLPWPNYNNQRAIALNGSQSINIGGSNKFKIKNKFTFSLWFKTDYKPSSQARLLTFHKGNIASSALSLSLKNNDIELIYSNASGDIKTIKETFSYSGNTWHHLAISYNGRTYTLFIDGTRVIKVRDSFSGMGSHSAHIGSFSGIQKGFLGKIDEVSIFKSSFNISQIEELYNGGEALNLITHSKAPSLVSWYQLGDQSSDNSSNIEDVHGNNNGNPLNISASDFTNDSP